MYSPEELAKMFQTSGEQDSMRLMFLEFASDMENTLPDNKEKEMFFMNLAFALNNALVSIANGQTKTQFEKSVQELKDKLNSPDAEGRIRLSGFEIQTDDNE